MVDNSNRGAGSPNPDPVTDQGRSPSLTPDEPQHRELNTSRAAEPRLSEANDAATVEGFEARIEAAAENGDALAEARAWAGLADVQTRLSDYASALESARNAEACARLVGVRGGAELANALFRQGWSFMKLGIMDAALAMGEQALDVSATHQIRDMMAKSLRLLGSVLTTQGRNFDLATSYFEKALSLYVDLDDQLGQGYLLNNLGVLAFKRGDYQAAVSRYEETLEIARQIGSRDLQGLARNNLGEAQVGLGNYEAAEALLSEGIRDAEAEGRGEYSSIAYSYLAKAYIGQSRAAEALPLAKRALSLALESEDQLHIAAAFRALGMVLTQLEAAGSGADSPDSDEAQRALTPRLCFRESVRLFAELRADAERARTLREWARYEREHGDQQEAQRRWQEARTLFAQHGMRLEVDRMSREE